MLQHILGTTDISFFIACVIYAIVGAALSLLAHSLSRDKTDITNPPKFNLLFLLWDNKKRILFNFLLILITIRFSKQITGMQTNEFVSLLIGFGYDRLGKFLQAKSILIGK